MFGVFPVAWDRCQQQESHSEGAVHGVFEVGTADKEVVKGFPSWNSKQGLVCVTASRDPGGGSHAY